MQTTLNKIKQHSPCTEGWAKLLSHLGKTEADDEPLQLITILQSNGLDDALWALRAVDGKDRGIRLMACDFADSVGYLSNDERCNKAIEVSRRYANGEATIGELNAARAAALDAARDAARDAALAAALNAAWAARAAALDAALDAAWDARAAAWNAALDAAWDARAAAWNAARAAALDAARAAEKEKQLQIFLKYASL